jgi:hypothetical protein
MCARFRWISSAGGINNCEGDCGEFILLDKLHGGTIAVVQCRFSRCLVLQVKSRTDRVNNITKKFKNKEREKEKLF